MSNSGEPVSKEAAELNEQLRQSLNKAQALLLNRWLFCRPDVSYALPFIEPMKNVRTKEGQQWVTLQIPMYRINDLFFDTQTGYSMYGYNQFQPVGRHDSGSDWFRIYKRDAKTLIDMLERIRKIYVPEGQPLIDEEVFILKELRDWVNQHDE